MLYILSIIYISLSVNVYIIYYIYKFKCQYIVYICRKYMGT